MIRFLAPMFLFSLFLAQSALAGGRVEFATGTVGAVNAKGESRALERGQRVEAGDTVSTGSGGEVHLVMDDHALIALRPNTRLVVEEYVADGGSGDRSLLRLTRGVMRSVTGWIGKTSPRNYEVRTATATIGIRGTDHEIGIVDDGAEAGTYDKVNEGETRLRNPAGEVNVRPGGAAFVPQGKPVAPRVLDKVPAFFQPTPNEKRIDDTKGKLAREMDDRLDSRRKEKRDAAGAPATCGPNSPAMLALQEFIRAYESGDVGTLQTKLNPAMPGYQRFLDGLMRDFATQKQIRIFVKDIQAQCGPDVTNLVMTWEKRFLDLVTFQPGFFSGQVSILMHRDGTGWRPGAFAGDNPFARANGVLARFTFGPAFSLASVTAQPAPVPVTLEVIDPDIAGQGSLNLQVATSTGDVESVMLSETTPGRFTRSMLTVSTQMPAPGNGVIEVAGGIQISARYVDQQPGNNLPATVLTRSINPVGQPAAATDTTPNPFSFMPVTQAVAGSTVNSAPVTISGINAPAPVTIMGGSYSVNGGPFTSAPGSITNNQNVVIRVTASATSGASVSAMLTIGGVAGTFTVTTATAMIDTMPDPFSFPPVTGAPTSSLVPSGIVTITGINSAAPVSVAGGEASVNGGPFSAAPGSIANNQTLRLRGMSSPIAGSITMVSATVGGVVANFMITTAGAVADTMPDPFTFIPVTNAALSAFQSSNIINITGIDSPAPVSVSGGFVSINGGPFVTAGTITNGQTLAARALSSGIAGATTMATVNVGGVIGTFSITTTPPDTVPDPFNFSPIANQQPSVLVTSTIATINGITGPSPVSIVGGSYSIAGGPFTAGPGTVNNGETLQLRVTSSAVADGTGAVTATVNVGGVMASWTVNTGDGVPNPFSFPNVVTNVTGLPPCLNPASQYTTATITPTGFGLPLMATITFSAGGASPANALISVNGSAFGPGPVVVGGFDTIAIRFNSVAVNTTLSGPATRATVTIGGVSANVTQTCL